MNTDERDARPVIAEAYPSGEGGAWLLAVGQPVVGGFLDEILRVQLGTNGRTVRLLKDSGQLHP